MVVSAYFGFLVVVGDEGVLMMCRCRRKKGITNE